MHGAGMVCGSKAGFAHALQVHVFARLALPAQSITWTIVSLRPAAAPRRFSCSLAAASLAAVVSKVVRSSSLHGVTRRTTVRRS